MPSLYLYDGKSIPLTWGRYIPFFSKLVMYSYNYDCVHCTTLE